MSPSEFFVSYKVHSGLYNSSATGMEDRYFSGLWVQRDKGVPTAYYKPIRCADLYDEDNVSHMFWDNVQDMWCPDMRGAPVRVQNPSPKNAGNSTSDFFFVLDTCHHLANMTGRTDCMNET